MIFGIYTSILLARALQIIFVSQDINEIGRYDALSIGGLPGFSTRVIIADLKDGGRIPVL